MLNILAVDDEQCALDSLQGALRQGLPEANLICCASPRDALECVQAETLDIAFLDIDMREMSGLALARRLKAANPMVNVIFVTGYTDYALEAFGLHASGYLMKPVTPAQIKAELENLRRPIAHPAAERVRVACFGGFDVYVYGELVNITRPTCRELFAYLVHKRGASLTAAKIASVLWPDKPYTRALQSQVQKTVRNLQALLRARGVEDILIRKRNCVAIDPAKISCDYYDYLRGDARGLNAYRGRYLEEYSWADMPFEADEGLPI